MLLCQFLVGVSVFGSGGKLTVFLLWRENFITTGKNKVPVVCLAGVSVFGSGDYEWKKKRYSHLLAGNRQFFCCGGKFSLRPERKDTLRPEKKDTIVIFVLVQLELNLIQIR